jgi:hypothetical protein
MDLKSGIQKEHLSDPEGLITYNILLPLTYTYFLRTTIPDLEALEAKQNDEDQSLDMEESQTLAASMYLRHYLAYQFADTETVTLTISPKKTISNRQPLAILMHL